MTSEPAPRRDTVSCHNCGTLLGTLNIPSHGKHAVRLKNPGRVATLLPGVRVFCDLFMGRVEIICPVCGSCGRTMRADRFRGVIVHADESAEGAC